jgi:hypothetical protein
MRIHVTLHASVLNRQDRGELEMSDLLYLALGVGVFLLFAGYAAALRRI